ncbi:MurR/RpiR family transcriptional regulator [Lacticaseibacillus hulanensis]|uniref:MurR/RpiR family transcriptional regulator n=1 Tax=Lacticaseibacillus hulanensis TaxID=2493111 RepID=UPI0013E2A0FE|nr:MurR/RpiR family transcriptional regulator [Lacticaseibacillus hulanensis]
MLITEKLEAAVDFTPVDSTIANVILADPHQVTGLTVQELASKANCSHSAVVRLCKKLGYTGYRDFTLTLLREISAATESDADVNFPFGAHDTLRDAAEKLATLGQASIAAAQQHLDMPILVRAVQTLIHAHRIFLYGHGDSSLAVQSFANKLNKIDIYPVLADLLGESNWNSTNATEADCALLVSYRGQSHSHLQVMRYLKQRHVPTILITGRPQSSMAKLATACLEVPGDEYDFMKMGTIASQSAIDYLLTVLFAGIYSHNYDDNLSGLKQRQASLTNGLLAEDGVTKPHP